MGVAERREREKLERRETILAAATEVFLLRGLASATMDQIARGAELSKGALYLYFKSKDELYLAVTLSAMGTVMAEVEAVTARSYPNGLARLSRFLNTVVTMATAQGSRYRVAMSWLGTSYEVDASSPMFAMYQAHVGELFRTGVAAIEAGQRDGSIAADAPAGQLMSRLWAAMTGAILAEQSGGELRRRIGRPVELEGLAWGTVQLLLRGISRAAEKASTGEPAGQVAARRTSAAKRAEQVAARRTSAAKRAEQTAPRALETPK